MENLKTFDEFNEGLKYGKFKFKKTSNAESEEDIKKEDELKDRLEEKPKKRAETSIRNKWLNRRNKRSTK